jgi:hypothetical protein
VSSSDVKLIPSPKVIAALMLVAGLCHAVPPEEPLKLETLTTTKGKTYKNLIVREVTPSGIKIFHEGGTATLPYEELPQDLRKVVGGFDPAKAKQHREEEERKLKDQEGQLDRELSKMGRQSLPCHDTFQGSDTGFTPRPRKAPGRQRRTHRPNRRLQDRRQTGRVQGRDQLHRQALRQQRGAGWSHRNL